MNISGCAGPTSLRQLFSSEVVAEEKKQPKTVGECVGVAGSWETVYKTQHRQGITTSDLEDGALLKLGPETALNLRLPLSV